MKKNNLNESVNGVASVASTKSINDTQWAKYHTKGGHGFAAEDANALADKWSGKHVDQVGVNNAKNGADRIVNGVEIQTKYCSTASTSIDAAFENGIIDRVLTTDLVYQTPELLSREWYVNCSMSKYIAYLIDTLNHDASISDLLIPNDRIQAALTKYKAKQSEK